LSGFNIHYMLAEILKRKNRSLLMLSGIALGVIFFLCLNALADAYYQASAVPLREMGTDITVQKSNGPIPEKFEGAILPCADAIIRESAVADVAKIRGVEEISPALLLWVFDSGMENASNFKMVLGIDLNQEAGPGQLKNRVVEGRFLEYSDQDKALVDENFASMKGIKSGDLISIAGQNYQVVGVVATPAASLVGATNVYIPLKEAQKIASHASQINNFQENDVNLLFIKADSSQIAAIQSEISKALPGSTVSTPASFLAYMGGLAAASKRLALLGTIIALLAALAMAVRTSASNIWERRKDIAIMKAVGWTSSDVRRQLIAENIVLGLVGGFIGIVVSLFFTLALSGQVVAIPLPWELNPYPHFYITNQVAKSIIVPLAVHITWSAAFLALVLGMTMALLTTFLVSRRLTKIKPSEVLRYE
jgi:lipoprotein-releasing system permease protein